MQGDEGRMLGHQVSHRYSKSDIEACGAMCEHTCVMLGVYMAALERPGQLVMA